MKSKVLSKTIIMPELLREAELQGFSYNILNTQVELHISLYHSVKLKLNEILDYFHLLGFLLVDWDENEVFDFDQYKITYLSLITTKDILSSNNNISIEEIKDILKIK